MKLSIRGPIISTDDQWIYDWFGIDATSPRKVQEQLHQAENEDVEMDINSGGGSVFAASEIYALLKAHPGKVTGNILGIAASAASVIAMASDDLRMAPTGQMMIHNASMGTQGDYRDMNHTSNFLQNVNQTIANAYQIKSGKPYDELLAMMDQETWLTPQQAKEHQLIDQIMFSDQAPQVVASVGTGMIPPEVIEKLRNELKVGSGSPSNAITHVAPPVTELEPKNHEEETPLKITYEDLQNNHPDLFNQIKQEGYQSGIDAENTRIKEIENLQLPGNEELVNQAKFETKASVNELAVQIIMAEKQRGQNFLQNRQEDAESLNQFKGGTAPEPKGKGAGKEEDMLLNIIHSQKGGPNS